MKNHTYYYFSDIVYIKIFDPYNIKRLKIIQKYSYLVHWIQGDQRFEISKNLQFKSFVPYFQQSGWILWRN